MIFKVGADMQVQCLSAGGKDRVIGGRDVLRNVRIAVAKYGTRSK